jgi:hypothetical protein
VFQSQFQYTPSSLAKVSRRFSGRLKEANHRPNDVKRSVVSFVEETTR